MTRPKGSSNVSAFSFGRGRAELPVMVPRFPLICARVGCPGLCTNLKLRFQRLLNFMRQQPNAVAAPTAVNLGAVLIEQPIARHTP